MKTYVVIDDAHVGYRIHKADCRDIERDIRKGAVNAAYELEVEDGVDPARALDIHLAAGGIAEGYGQTPEEWADENSYDARVLPCTKEAK